MTMYAWTRIQNGVERDEVDPKVILKTNYIEYGSEVTADDLGIDDVEFQALVDGGAVRDYAPPNLPATFTGSPLDFLRDQAKKAEELTLSQNLGGYVMNGPDETGRLLGVGGEIEPGTGPDDTAAAPERTPLPGAQTS